MQVIYAETSSVRIRQIAADGFAALWCLASIWLGRAVHQVAQQLARPGEYLRDASSDVSERADGFASRLPSALRGPTEALGSLGNRVGAAGEAQIDVANDLALVLGVLTAIAPIVWLLARHLPGRIRWNREAAGVKTLRASQGFSELMARRALVNQPLDRLARLTDDPVADFEQGNYEGLARLELAGLGLHPSAERLPSVRRQDTR